MDTKKLRQLILQIGSETPDNLDAAKNTKVYNKGTKDSIFVIRENSEKEKELVESLHQIEDFIDTHKNFFDQEDSTAIRVVLLLVSALEEGALKDSNV